MNGPEQDATALTWRRLLFSYRGRIDRRTYFWRFVPAVTLLFLGVFLGGIPLISGWRGEVVADRPIGAADILAGLYVVMVGALYLWMASAAPAKRLHDRDMSMLVLLLPYLGLTLLGGAAQVWHLRAPLPALLQVPGALLALAVGVALLRRSDGPNRFGAAPMRFGPPPPRPPGRLALLVDLAALGLVLVLVLVCRSLVVEPFNAPSSSMTPTVLDGDYFFVSKPAYGYSRYAFPAWCPGFAGRFFGRTPRRGDVVVFRLPRDPSESYIKRVIGLPGDRVQMTDGRLSLNGVEVKRERVGDFIVRDERVPQYRETLPDGTRYQILQRDRPGPLDTTIEFIVPPGHVFVLGDFRSNSEDSRALATVGYIPLENLVGRAIDRFFSVDPETGSIRLPRMLTAVGE